MFSSKFSSHEVHDEFEIRGSTKAAVDEWAKTVVYGRMD
jgi:hypothetical protein